MKNILLVLLEAGHKVFRPANAIVHDDTLRANQGQDRGPAFSFWRALVS